MKKVFRALRTWFRGDRTCARRPIVNNKRRLTVEMLEERLAPAGDFRSVIGADAVQSLYPYRGTGYTVAILDTGIDYRDTDLGGGFGTGKRVVAGYDFVNNDADPMDDNGHGTHLAGIIGSSSTSMLGIAPNVNFAALKVLDANMNGSWAAIESALQWVIAHKAEYNIVGINLSLGAGNYTSNPYNLLDDEFASLKNLGVFTAVASGNKFYTYGSQVGLSYPSISPNVVSVGATWAADASSVTFSSGATDTNPTTDRIVSFTQRSSALSLLAPGAWITSDWLNNTTKVMGGTSMATAVVTGSAVLLHQAMDQTGRSADATQDKILSLMKSTGVTIVDNNTATNVTPTGLSFKRINLKAAMDTIGQPVAAPTFAPISNQTLQVNGSIVVPLSVTNTGGSAITYSAYRVYLPAQAYDLDQQLGLKYLGSYYQNKNGLNEKWVIGSNNVWYAILPNGEVRRWTGSVSAMMTAANLIGTLDSAYHADPSKLWNAPYAGMPPAVFEFSGNNLKILGPAYWVGTYKVVVTAKVGNYSLQQSFNVTEVAGNSAPALSTVANQTITHAQRTKTLTLSATDADKDSIAYSAQVLASNGQMPAVSVSVQGNQLTVSPMLAFVGTCTIQVGASDGKATTNSTFTFTVTNAGPVLAAITDQSGSHGQDIRVSLSGSDADGDALTYSATVNAVNGQTPALQVTVSGSTVTIHPTKPMIGTFSITASATDGAATATRTFNVTLTNTGPTLAAVADQTMAKGQTSLTVALTATDADNDTLSYQAVARTPDATLYQLNQQYAFQPSNATYYQNLYGYNEKWLIGKNNLWYMLLPDGRIYRWTLSIAQTMTSANLVATVDTRVYVEPRLLWNANPATTPALTYSFQNNQLTIQRSASLTGIFFIDVTVSDGFTTTTQTIKLTLN